MTGVARVAALLLLLLLLLLLAHLPAPYAAVVAATVLGMFAVACAGLARVLVTAPVTRAPAWQRAGGTGGAT